MAADEVWVTGLGLLTAAGDGAAATWERVLRGESTAVAEHEPGPVHLACRVAAFDQARIGALRARKPDRSAELAVLAAREAVVDAGWDTARWDGARVGVVVGTSSGNTHTHEVQHRALLDGGPRDMSPFAVSSTLGNSVAAQLSMELAAKGGCLTVNTACASGATALGVALDLLRAHRCDVVIAGGTDAPLTPYYIAGFDRVGALSRRFADPAGASRPFDADRDGFVLAEGAGMLVLERAADARARGARPRARLLGYGAASDAHHVAQPCPAGSGLTAAIRAALRDAQVTAGEVGYVNAHATGTPLGDRIEAAALAELLPHRPAVSSTKAVTGHPQGAAGAIEAALTVLAVETGTVPANVNLDRPDVGVDLDLLTRSRTGPVPLALSTSVGFGGHNAALAVAAP
ncbi:beta-ketoacyl-[acyl-carrier-protein] synthase family protein [Actinokineospora globicatena]|uniref:3-oxoacyl-[acyl-carrier-protein] synthase 2 n=1 Tax=Actinokineospora globicatena TaxID=103729 RepID=A0A9W6QJS1_9PSEU|nr:beta-ketoacyl-[acyl-carrier-protein] synthase family protein [Actinokineospora globicatena]GLW89872.1 3-oxoacyl-[acyl-carrier-protein] synthase 2 [Actinokineospora globicatena]